jgi:purine-binding chemotaxis protein CheW
MEQVMEAMIVFRIGDEHIGVDIAHVREVTETLSPVPVPRSPDFLLGLVNIRGEVIPVISLKRRLGFSGDETAKLILIVEDDGRLAGVKVDELYGTKKVTGSRINRRSELLSTRKEKDFFYGVYEDDGKPILILDLGKVLSKEDK